MFLKYGFNRALGRFSISSYYFLFMVTTVFMLFMMVQLLDFEEKIVITKDLFSPCNLNFSRHKQNLSLPPVSGYEGRIFKDIKITYQDPKTYKGPVILGWEPDKDRNLTRYARPTEDTVLMDPLACPNIRKPRRIEMVILQHSAPNNFDIRHANRATWMTFAKSFPEIRILFAVGLPTVSLEDLQNINHDVQKKLESEFEMFGDILQVDSIESYSNNTLKSILTLKYLLGVDWERLSIEGTPPRFLMRADDDIYVNIPLVHQLILEDKRWLPLPTSPYWPPILGGLLDNSVVVKIPVDLMSNKYAPKTWYECPTYFHDGNGTYPPYFQGAGYFLPWWSLPCIYQQSFQLPYFFIEDVFISGFVADRCSVPKHDLPGFTMYRPNKKIRQLNLRKDILIHYVDQTYKVRAHRVIASAYLESKP